MRGPPSSGEVHQHHRPGGTPVFAFGRLLPSTPNGPKVGDARSTAGLARGRSVGVGPVAAPRTSPVPDAYRDAGVRQHRTRGVGDGSGCGDYGRQLADRFLRGSGGRLRSHRVRQVRNAQPPTETQGAQVLCGMGDRCRWSCGVHRVRLAWPAPCLADAQRELAFGRGMDPVGGGWACCGRRPDPVTGHRTAKERHGRGYAAGWPGRRRGIVGGNQRPQVSPPRLRADCAPAITGLTTSAPSCSGSSHW
jgi:hypothetical protein